MQKKFLGTKKTSCLIILASSVLLMSACSTKSTTPKNDCLPDVPCVPCILPVPYYPVTAADLPLHKSSLK